MPGDRGEATVAKPPVVSVIIAAYNAAAYIAETCSSVLNQTFRSLELIVVDDGSTDETPSIVGAIAETDRRVRLIRQANLGVAAARNCAIAAASGEFVAPLDADDLWGSTKLEQQVRRMEECGPETGMVYSWWAWIDLANNVTDRSPRWRIEGRVLERLIEVNFTGNASVPLYRRSWLNQVGGYNATMRDQGAHGCEDWDLAIRVAERASVAVVPEILVGYRRRTDSMSTACDTMWRSQQQVMAAMVARQPSIPRKILRRSNGQFALYLAGVSFWSGQYLAAIRWALRVRSISLLVFVLPYVMGVVVHRLFSGRQAPLKFSAGSGRFDEASLGEPLIPYAKIYARLWEGRDLEGRLSSPILQIGAVIVACVVSGWVHWGNDGLWFQGDSPRHAATGLFLADLLRSFPSQPLDYALSYYARYPIIVPMAYPPLFYLLEAGAFTAVSPSPHVAKVLVLTFAGIAGVYVAFWGRRRIAPIAGWAGALMVLMPAMVRYSNAVMLNVPALALTLGALFHLQEWSSTESPRHRLLFILLAIAAILTYYPSAVVIPIAVVWLVSSKRLSTMRSVTLWSSAVLAVALLLFVRYAFPVFSGRNSPQLVRLFNSGAWAFYLSRLPFLATYPWLALGAIGLVLGLRTPALRKQAIRLALVYPVLLLCLVLLPAFTDRYALMLTPITILVGFLGLAIAIERAGPRGTAVAVAALVLMFSWTAWAGLRTSVPVVSGFKPVADYLRMNGPRDGVLYSGRYDGVLGFYLQASDRQFERRLVPTSRLLFGLQQNSRFVFVETPHVNSAEDVVALIRHQSGCRYVVVETAPDSELPISDRYFRESLAGPDFERVESFPVNAGLIREIVVYRVKGAIDEAPPIDLQFPSFSGRVFRSIEPIQRR